MKDNFSKQAALYATYRPGYPTELFEFILQVTRGRSAAWDCATGNGQTAKELARYFERVVATDISQQQLDNAEQAVNIFYSLQPAEQTNFPDNSFDLITISQALHWLRFDDFYREVRRVAKNEAWIAAWMYGLIRISPEADQLISDHHFQVLGKYWDSERKYVDDNYTTIPFPFEEIKCPEFRMQYEWTIEELEGYLNTWSALQKFIVVNGFNPVDKLISAIKGLSPNKKLGISFPLRLRMGRIDK
ncbi:MAG: class I SAM-dependent methyltransferase [Ferruginibacter sp.]|nr:class I SAM-dependent methyltransferase [Chitinophagaceae bacterium]